MQQLEQRWVFWKNIIPVTFTSLATCSSAASIPVNMDTAKKMGVSSKLINDASLALGTSEVKVLDMAAAYATLANGGYAVWPYGILEIFSRDGYEKYMRKVDNTRRIIDSSDVKNLNDMITLALESI